jgi:hypothetical protein
MFFRLSQSLFFLEKRRNHKKNSQTVGIRKIIKLPQARSNSETHPWTRSFNTETLYLNHITNYNLYRLNVWAKWFAESSVKRRGQHVSKIKVGYPCNRQWRPMGLWGVGDPTIGPQMAVRLSDLRAVKLSGLRAGRVSPPSPGKIPDTHFC